MTTLNTNTKPANDLTDDEFLSRDIDLIYDAVTDIYELSKHDGIRLDLISNTLRLLLEKMANAFNQIQSNLSMQAFIDEIKEVETEVERTEIMNKYISAHASPRRTYE
jgi:hypothetical protein